MLRTSFLLLLLAFPAVAHAGPIAELPPGEWYRIPNSRMDAVAFEWSPRTPGRTRGIMQAWGGGAYDTREERLLVHGGGHGDYGGSEVYAMDLDVAEERPGDNPWARLSDPDAYDALDPDCANEDNLTDGDHRRSQHTYGRLAYLPSRHALCDTGGSIGYVYCPALRQLDCFDLTTNAWTLGLAEGRASGTGSTGAVHPETGEWWLQGGSGSGLLGRLDPDTLTWTYGHYDNVPGSSPRNLTAAIDPSRGLFVAIGSGRMWVLPLESFAPDETELSEHAVTPSGDASILDARAPGLAYDPVSDRMVAWDGGADVFLLDLDTMTWSRETMGGEPPGDAANNGTYGRFQRSPRYGVFVVVSDTGEDVYALRLPGTPLPEPDAGVADPDAGTPSTDAGAPGPNGGPDAGSHAVVDAGDGETRTESGCGCAIPGSAPSTSWLGGLLLLGLAQRRARRRWKSPATSAR